MHRSEAQMTSAVSTPRDDEHELRNTTNTAERAVKHEQKELD